MWLREHQQYALITVPIIAFLEAFVGVGLLISGAILLSVCTVLYVEKIASLEQILALVFFGAVLSDHSGYYIGRFIGPKFHHTQFAIKRAGLLQKCEKVIIKCGALSIIFGRFVTPIRSVVPLLAGISGMNRLKFTSYDVVACALWAVCLSLLVLGLEKLWN